MFGTAVWNALLISLIIVAPLTALASVKSKSISSTLVAGLVIWIVLSVINVLVIYFATPVVGASFLAVQKMFWWLWAEALVAAIILTWVASLDNDYPTVGGVIAVVALVIIAFTLPTQSCVATDNRAKNLVAQAEITVVTDNSVYPDTDANHMVLVSEQSARFKAKQSLASSSERNLGTFFELNAVTLMSIREHMYYVFDLRFTGWRNKNQANSIIPGYVLVDAENPDLPAEAKLGYEILYAPGSWFGNRLDRYLWSHGYSAEVVTDVTLEIDDDWKPYYTASVDRETLGGKQSVPKEMITIDPQTGDIQRYTLDKIPDWVDRIYSKETVKSMLTWWGKWAQAPYKVNENSANRYKLSQDPVLVYTKGGHPEWQVIMTSYNSDTAASYLVLFDARDNKARAFQIPGLGVESSVDHIILNSQANLKKNQPVHVALHKIYGQLTWVAPLIQPVGEGQDLSKVESAPQGLALMAANDNNGASIVVARSKEEALSAYRQLIARGFNNDDPTENAKNVTVEGIVTNLQARSEGGNTAFYFFLQGDTMHVYRYVMGGEVNLEIPFIHDGVNVRFTYIDDGSARRDVGSYDDLGLSIESK